ncbi:DUF1330 domain-containing protein [Parasedimentitalea maritima]|uniref:DUF1330 domain-containing protein n=1 Tax=Parasedimentitalea maritima TaxID=2578117 RepID=A0A6A4RAM9_9RHOB|nr:DUF1330 domain-containing protein [Zongyanglinia marina]KAE9629282.1 DUF1330 domain-containing protein [Zongyanglinia marina]
MPVLIVSRVSIKDPEAMASYMEAAPETVAAYGGNYLARTPQIEVLEGVADYDRMVVVEFPDRTCALAWYESEEYRDLRQSRWNAAEAHIVVIPTEK